MRSRWWNLLTQRRCARLSQRLPGFLNSCPLNAWRVCNNILADVRMILAVLFPERQRKPINTSDVSCREVLKRGTATPKCHAK